MTIGDVARRAEVSTAAVSRRLDHPGRVDEDTRAGVPAVIAELRHLPGEVARGLASRSSRTVGVVIDLSEAPYAALMNRAVAEHRGSRTLPHRHDHRPFALPRVPTPRLTTVRQPPREMGHASARLARSLATGDAARAADVVRIFDPEIVERESTGPPPATVRAPHLIAFPMPDSDDTTMKTMNFLNATLELTQDGFVLVLPGGAVLRGKRTRNLPPPGRVVAGVEPEHLRVAAPWEPNTFLARVERIEPGGARNLLELDVAGNRITVVDPTLTPLEPGVTVALAVDPEHVRAFARQPDV